LTDVRNKDDLTDYTGELRAVFGVRITLAFDVPCAATGGSDGDAGTAGDNTLFAVQGIFVP
jgi:hypothetical protein